MSKIHYKSLEEIELIRESSLLVSKTLAEVAKVIKPGITTIALDKLAYEFIRDNGAVPAFLNYGGFPNSLCISPNEQVVHGFPNDYVIKEGDLIFFSFGGKDVDHVGVYLNNNFFVHASTTRGVIVDDLNLPVYQNAIVKTGNLK